MGTDLFRSRIITTPGHKFTSNICSHKNNHRSEGPDAQRMSGNKLSHLHVVSSPNAHFCGCHKAEWQRHFMSIIGKIEYNIRIVVFVSEAIGEYLLLLQ